MKILSKALSLLLVLSMLCTLAIPAMAEEVADFTLEYDKSSYEVGDTAYVTVKLNKAYTIANFNMRVWYDPEVFTYDAANSSIGEVLSNCVLKNLVDPVESNYTSEANYLNNGWKPVNIIAAYLGVDGSYPVGTIAKLAFTVKAASESAPFTISIRELSDINAVNYTSAATVAATTYVTTTAPVHTHTYGDPTWNWADDYSSASAAFTCTNNDDTQTVNAAITTDTSDSTKTVYTATVTFNGQTYTDTKEAAKDDSGDDGDDTTTGYTVTASEDKTISVGQTAQVTVTVGSENATVYNAYDLTLTYDTDKLTYVSGAAADEGATVEENNGTIRVIGYGADKNLSTAAVTLTFTGKAVGDADVKITSAKIDIGNHAITADAPEATKTDDTTVITISAYTVTLGEGLSGESTAQPNESYTFTATDYANYEYAITATMGGEPVTPTSNGDGTYTISNVTGNLVINAAKNPRTYTVTINGEDTTGAATATYGTAYTFTVTEDAAYTYSVSVTVNGNPYTLSNGYTIAGTDITGPIVITVTKTAKDPGSNTVNVTKPDYVDGDDTATKGEDYDFSITEEDGYEYGDPIVKVDGTDITDKIVENDDGSYTIPGQYVTGDITIAVERTDAITVDVVEYITLDEKSMYLVTVSGVIDGKVAKYDGSSMYWSEEYDAYAYLVISADGLEAVKTAAAEKVTVAEGAAADTVVYTGDVNGTNVIDVNDAQLTYYMYNAKYEDFNTVNMLKFLNADVNADKTVSSADAAAIVSIIKGN